MELTVTILPQGKKLTARDGSLLLDILRKYDLAPDAPCAGTGNCGKCTVIVDGEAVRSCRFVVTKDVTVSLSEKDAKTRILEEGFGADTDMQPWNAGHMLAYDIGTTTVVCYLLEENTGKQLASASTVNPQQSFGADVISRIRSARDGERENLTNLIRAKMAELMQTVCMDAKITPAAIGTVSVVGNPCMQQLFLGMDVENLAQIPFAPALTDKAVVDAAAYLPECWNAKLLIVPDIAGFVGADTVGCVLATDLDRQEEITLLVDIGTNGELVLGNRHRMAACATAAGPALEGACIRFGMRAAAGAIDHVWMEDGALRCSVIGGGKAVGICGSGLIDAVAVLVETGLVNRRGRLASHLREAEGQRVFDLIDGVYLTQEDIRQVQMAKSAIAAGIHLMADHLNIKVADIQQVLLAGAFGSFIHAENACRMGLLPKELAGKIRAVGNAAGSGARRLACSKQELDRAQEIVEKTEFLELASLRAFPRCFAKNMEFER